MRGLALLSAAVYALASMSGVLVNKAVFATYDFGFPLVILLLQLIVTTLGMVVAAPPPLPERLLPLVPVSFSFVFNVFAGLLALQVTNVPMFSAFRRLSVLAVMLVETLAFGKRESRYVELSVATMTLGSLVAAAGDAQANLVGYALVFVNNFATAAYLVALKRASKTVKLSSVSMTFYVNLVSIPIAFAVCVLTGQLQGAIAAVRRAPELQSAGFAFAILASSCSAFAINLSTLWCTAANTPLTTAIAGQTKNMMQTALGMVLWNYRLTALNALGLLVAAVGSGMFGHAKFILASGGAGSGGGMGSGSGSGGGGAAAAAVARYPHQHHHPRRHAQPHHHYPHATSNDGVAEPTIMTTSKAAAAAAAAGDDEARDASNGKAKYNGDYRGGAPAP